MTKVLIVQDENQIREEVMDWLQFEGYEVIGAANGLAGLEAACREIPDVIISDIAMPGMDGHRLLTEVRSNPQLHHIPFVFLTASTQYDSMRKSMAMGADDYLTKPFTRDDVLNAVHSRWNRKMAQDAQLQAQMSLLHEAINQEREKMQLKSRLVAMFSHDFRNPLTIILTSSNLIRDYGDELYAADRQKYLDRIDGSVLLLLNMLDDMLTVAHMETGRLEYNPQMLDLPAYIESIVEEFRLLLMGHTRSLLFYSNVQTPIAVDSKLFRQVLVNLISNAVKYSPANSKVLITLTNWGDGVELVVKDEGIGIPEKDIPHLFEPFYRASNVQDKQGTGLGLAIVKEVIALSGGSIQVMSTLGKGTAFIIRIPQNKNVR